MYSFWIGYDRRQHLAWNVCVKSLLAHLRFPWPVHPISIEHLGGRYARPTEQRGEALWDVISAASCATTFSIARFWTPYLAQSRWAIYLDGDFLIRANVAELLCCLDDRYAVQVCQHAVAHPEGRKLQGQPQTHYDRKNWSSLIAFNVDHAAHRRESDAVDRMTGLQLHQFAQYRDHEIGTLPLRWNHLVSVCRPNPEARAAHFTLGTPDTPGRYGQEFADEWLHHAAELRACSNDDDMTRIEKIGTAERTWGQWGVMPAGEKLVDTVVDQ